MSILYRHVSRRKPGFVELVAMAETVGQHPAMATYLAEFTFRMRTPLRTAETAPFVLTSPTLHQYLTSATLTATPVDGAIRQFDITATYEGDIDVGTFMGGTYDDGVGIKPASTFSPFFPPFDCAQFIAAVLYHLSGLTLQSNVFWPLQDYGDYVSKVQWVLPTGERYPAIPVNWPFFPLRGGLDDGSRHATAADFVDVQDALNGTKETPLWRLVLAGAHRHRNIDIRDVVVRCATALDVGVQAISPSATVNMCLFRGEVTGTRTPDLRTTDQPLYDQLSRLWYSRHGIVHRGQAMLYDKNPKNNQPLRPLTADDTEGFLCAVPKGIAFIAANPP